MKGKIMNEDDLKMLRRAENMTIIKHLEAVKRIIDTKCYRCNKKSCMGCIFSIGEIQGSITAAIKLMRNYKYTKNV